MHACAKHDTENKSRCMRAIHATWKMAFEHQIELWDLCYYSALVVTMIQNWYLYIFKDLYFKGFQGSSHPRLVNSLMYS